MKSSFVAAATLAAAIPLMPAHGSAPEAVPQMAQAAFELAPLPYAVDALAPVIDSQTMTIHHGKHHRAYVDALNKAVAADPALQGLSLEQLFANAGRYAPTVRNNAGE